METIIICQGNLFDLRTTDGVEAILDKIENNSTRQAIGDQTSLCHVLLQEILCLVKEGES